MIELSIGDQAPDFTLPTNGGGTVSLSALSGKKVVIYFYPKDNTQSCTVEAIDFTRLSAEFEDAGTTIIGISPDSVKKHDNFCKKHSLGITLAADEQKQAIDAYGLWVEKTMYGLKYMGVERTTLLIDAAGRIARIWRKVKVKGHAEEVLEAAKLLR
ncbi:peroxiredoxin [Rhizobium sp. KVB221]|uniref:thioredoxin-dependent peroxiredoxin n=1 Tax=Rhizobium setariae TaxID=2801340 RepID=A0A936YS76_9HYPH|nr:peroxiredoxin [Rhizobium setariae]MBL0373832.1 peroxiredoxin [Rhizobium setariae]